LIRENYLACVPLATPTVSAGSSAPCLLQRTIGVGFRQTPGAYSRQCDSFQYIDEPEIIGMVAAN